MRTSEEREREVWACWEGRSRANNKVIQRLLCDQSNFAPKSKPSLHIKQCKNSSAFSIDSLNYNFGSPLSTLLKKNSASPSLGSPLLNQSCPWIKFAVVTGYFSESDQTLFQSFPLFFVHSILEALKHLWKITISLRHLLPPWNTDFAQRLPPSTQSLGYFLTPLYSITLSFSTSPLYITFKRFRFLSKEIIFEFRTFHFPHMLIYEIRNGQT